MQVFATKLRERAVELAIAHAEAARRAGLSERRYGHYVNGIREPDLATLVRIAESLQTTPNDLLGVGDKLEESHRRLMLDRLTSAARVLGDEVLEGLLIQTEALAAARKSVAAPRAKSNVSAKSRSDVPAARRARKATNRGNH